MTRKEYYRGKPNAKYGIWNDMKKKFQFGICEDTPCKAEIKLFKLIGKDAYKWRYEARRINP